MLRLPVSLAVGPPPPNAGASSVPVTVMVSVWVAVAPLAGSVCDEALAWVCAVSGAMRELDIVALAGLQARIAGWQAVLQQQPSTLDELKDVLQVVDTIRWVLRLECI